MIPVVTPTTLLMFHCPVKGESELLFLHDTIMKRIKMELNTLVLIVRRFNLQTVYLKLTLFDFEKAVLQSCYLFPCIVEIVTSEIGHQYYHTIICIFVVSFTPELAPLEPRLSIRVTESLPIKWSRGKY